MLSGELGVYQAFLVRWYIGGGYMDVSEVVVFYDCGKIENMHLYCDHILYSFPLYTFL